MHERRCAQKNDQLLRARHATHYVRNRNRATRQGTTRHDKHDDLERIPTRYCEPWCLVGTRWVVIHLSANRGRDDNNDDPWESGHNDGEDLCDPHSALG
eukprot:scaffold2640_cov180-Amphora_coffeaeformis.AAC.3